MERRTNSRNRFVRRVVVGVHDSQFRQAGGKVGVKYTKGGRNNETIWVRTGFDVRDNEADGALSSFQQKS